MDGGHWETDGSGTLPDLRFLTDEAPQVTKERKSVKYRCFTHFDDQRCMPFYADDTAFRTLKRRRLDCVGDSGYVEQPFLHYLTDPFEVSQRQHHTFQWLSTPQPAAAIIRRFALDRTLGAPPCLAAVNQALKCFGASQSVEEILDIIEDLLMDEGSVAMSTLADALSGLMVSQPVRAARVAFTLSTALSTPNAPVPTSLWVDLSNSLAGYAEASPEDVNEDFVAVFSNVVRFARQGGHRLKESVIAAVGKSMLHTKKHIKTSMKLVEEELLSGRNDADSDPVINSAFLSELLRICCDEAIATIETDLPMAVSRIEFSIDVIKFVYARKIHLKNTAFDSVLELCDRAGDYFRLCILFTAMCVLSVPTLRSFTRFVEVLSDPLDLGPRINSVLHGSKAEFLWWFMNKYAQMIWDATEGDREKAALTEVCRRFGILFSEDAGSTKLFGKLFSFLQPLGGDYRRAALDSFYISCRNRQRSAQYQPTDVLPNISAEEGISALLNTAPIILKEEILPSPVLRLSDALLRTLSKPEMYCSVITPLALNDLGAKAEHAAAFEGMMMNYRNRSGAVVLMPIDSVVSTAKLTPEGLALAVQWYQHKNSWFSILPLPLSLQVEGASPCEVSLQLFKKIREVGHQRALFVGGDDEEIKMASNANLKPAVHLRDLMTKLCSSSS